MLHERLEEDSMSLLDFGESLVQFVASFSDFVFVVLEEGGALLNLAQNFDCLVDYGNCKIVVIALGFE